MAHGSLAVWEWAYLYRIHLQEGPFISFYVFFFFLDHKDCFTVVYQPNHFYVCFNFVSLQHLLSHWHKMVAPSSPARAEWTCVVTVPSKLSVRKGHIFGYKKNDSWAVYSCSTAALFPFFGEVLCTDGSNAFFWWLSHISGIQLATQEKMPG